MPRGRLPVVFFVCAVPRLLALAVWPDPPPTLYTALARSLAEAHRFAIDGVPTARIEPLYSAILAGGLIVFGRGPWSMLVPQILIAAAAGVLLFLLTRAQSGSEPAAWTAVLLYALSPYLVRQSAAFMEIAVATALLIAAAWRMRVLRTTLQTMVAGLLLAAIVLTRTSFLPIAAGGLAIIAWREGLTRGLLALLMVGVSLAPWMAHSYRVDGSVFPSRIGENLFVSTSQWSASVVPRLNVDLIVDVSNDLARADLTQRGVASPGVGQLDDALLRLAVAYARAHPAATVWLKLRNAGYILQPRLLPFFERRGSAALVDGRLEIPEQARRPLAFELAAGLFQLVLLAGGATGLALRRHHIREDAFLLVILGSVIAVNTIFFPTSRLLAPMSFVLMFYTGVAVDRTLTRSDRRDLANPERA